jgi:hypothetical protein
VELLLLPDAVRTACSLPAALVCMLAALLNSEQWRVGLPDDNGIGPDDHGSSNVLLQAHASYVVNVKQQLEADANLQASRTLYGALYRLPNPASSAQLSRWARRLTCHHTSCHCTFHHDVLIAISAC